MPTTDANTDLSQAELMAMDLIDLGWDPDAIELAMGQADGWVEAAMEKAAREAQKRGMH